MLKADVAILGGGLAGSIAAAMLGRAGYSSIVIDPHASYPPDFRCEKLDAHQMQLLTSTGLSEAISHCFTHTPQLWLARRGRVVDKIYLDQYGFEYDTFVNAVRQEALKYSQHVVDKATGVSLSDRRQTVATQSGEEISCRVAIVASGLNPTLHEFLGIERRIVSRCHSVTLGFDIRRTDGQDFAFPALNYVSDRAEDRMAYLNLFRIDRRMRVNLFTYHHLREPGLHSFKHDPVGALEAIAPGLTEMIGRFDVVGPVRIRPTDLYVSQNYVRPGLVLIGDAFATACPASGTGTQKVFTDVHRLCSVYVPRWLAMGAIDEREISNFYADRIKKRSDRYSARKAYSLRALSTSNSVARRFQRWARLTFRIGKGMLRGWRNLAEA
ncbi:FAD-dependent oxidoreductase [Methylobacterium nodulans]|uniref:Monooxygenase FAD-binding n=1 Tax=Methylobacterium nodulans (strain LMG 21967 / CNCM I-2342 / ORS 2060) TaxID=460265 RepID=B8IEP2_METNO|nr:FAD-dependent monooxygenase [Methylobacterium nodulans]ACL61385.1 monooxygenase FAD-binding [Methylobacterium nodulans ORS 2060]